MNHEDTIRALLRNLTEWRRMSNFDPSIDSNSDFKSTGESNAAIEDLQHQLDQLGAEYHWSEQDLEYQLDAVHSSPD